MKRSEVLLWPANFGVRQAQRLGLLSIEAAKTVVRRQVETGQAVLRLLDPKELVAHREREMASGEARQKELAKLGEDLRGHDSDDPKYPTLVRFSAQSMLRLMDQWSTDGRRISMDARNQAERFLTESGVPSETIAAALNQLQIEKTAAQLLAETSDGPEAAIYSPS